MFPTALYVEEKVRAVRYIEDCSHEAGSTRLFNDKIRKTARKIPKCLVGFEILEFDRGPEINLA